MRRRHRSRGSPGDQPYRTAPEIVEDKEEDEDEDEIDTNDFLDQQDITKPHNLAELRPEAPVTQVQAMQLWERIDRVRIDAKRAKRSTTRRIMKAVSAKQSPDERVERLDFRMKIVWGLLVLGLTASGTAITAIFKWAGDNRETSIMIHQLIEQGRDLGGRLRLIEENMTRSVQRLDDLQQKVNK